jgi:hypothetical protein
MALQQKQQLSRNLLAIIWDLSVSFLKPSSRMRLAECEYFQAGGAIVRAGEYCDRMLFVATGRVEEFVTADIPSNSMFPMLLKHHIHKQVPRRVLMPGDYFGETERPTAWLQWSRSSFQSTQTTWKLLNGASFNEVLQFFCRYAPAGAACQSCSYY